MATPKNYMMPVMQRRDGADMSSGGRENTNQKLNLALLSASRLVHDKCDRQRETMAARQAAALERLTPLMEQRSRQLETLRDRQRSAVGTYRSMMDHLWGRRRGSAGSGKKP